MAGSVQGTYQIAYQGRFGSRTATVRLLDGVISGMDTGGGIWKGSYRLWDDRADVEMTVINPGLEGGASVLDGSEVQGVRRVTFAIPADLEGVRELAVRTNHGDLTVYLERLGR